MTVATDVAQINGPKPTIADVPARLAGATIARHNPIPKVVQGRIRPIINLEQIRSGDIVSLEIELESACDTNLESDGLRPLRVCYRWLDAAGHMQIQKEGMRTNLGVDLAPGKLHRAHITVMSPPNYLGNAVLRVVPVQENVGWFDDIGAFYCDIPVLITT